MNIFLFQLEFSSVETTEAFATSSDPIQQLPLSAKSVIILPPDLRLNFLLKGTVIPESQIDYYSKLIVLTSNNKNPVRKRGLAYTTNGPILLKPTCLRKNCLKANKQELTKRKERAKQNLLLVLREREREREERERRERERERERERS